MPFKFVILLHIFGLALRIRAHESYHFGVTNHHTRWHLHCPNNITKILRPPSNDQSLIFYECPLLSATAEVLPMELDFTFLCRPQSRLIWLIIDLYQYNRHLSSLRSTDLEMQVELNGGIQVRNSRNEFKNLTNRSILIHAFYMPFEAIEESLHRPIVMRVTINNRQQLNRCQFLFEDSRSWLDFLHARSCNSLPSPTLLIRNATCHFYPKPSIIEEAPPFVLSIEQSSDDAILISRKEYDRQLLLSTNSMLLKLTFAFLVITLLLLLLFFLYMLVYHHPLHVSPARI